MRHGGMSTLGLQEAKNEDKVKTLFSFDQVKNNLSILKPPPRKKI